MNKAEFLYWLQGLFELQEESKPLTDRQIKIIFDHLELVKRAEGKLAGYLLSLDEALKLINMKKVDRAWMTGLIEKHLQDEFQHLQPNPFLNPPTGLNGYEPLGDIYNNQRLC